MNKILSKSELEENLLNLLKAADTKTNDIILKMSRPCSSIYATSYRKS